jgi:hypothetical protein
MKVEIQPGRSRETREKMGRVEEDSRFIFGIPNAPGQGKSKSQIDQAGEK